METQKVCTICHGENFLPGPHGRLRNGKPPLCANCHSLERHRIIYSIWHKLKMHYPLSTYNCLHFAPDAAIDPASFASYLPSVYGKINSIDLCDISLNDKSMDAIICNHILEHVADDEKALQELMRVCSQRGILQLAVPDPAQIKETRDWGFPDKKKYGHYRIYGRDIIKLFRKAIPESYLLIITEEDPVTESDDMIFLFSNTDHLRKLQSVFARSCFGIVKNIENLNYVSA